jgi:hypothetical protein
VNKGKSKKLALIAVSNKLLKQSAAIAKWGRPYDETYVSVLVLMWLKINNNKAQRSIKTNL